MRYRAVKHCRQFIQCLTITLLLCLTQTSHSNRILPQNVYIWQKNWGAPLKPAIEQTTAYITGWRFLAGEYEPNGKIIYPSVQFNWLQQSLLPLTAVYRFDRLHPLPATKEVLSLIQNSPAYKIYNIRHIELDLDWPTNKLQHYINLLKCLKKNLPDTVDLNITMIPDWFRSPVFSELTEQVNQPILQVHSVDNPQIGLFTRQKALTYIYEMSRLSRRSFWVALPTYGLKIHTTSTGNIYSVEGENNFKTGQSGKELYSDPKEIRILLNKLRQNTPSHLQGILWFRLPTSKDQRNWSYDTWLAMIRNKPLKGQITIREIPDPYTPKTFKLTLINTGNIPLPLPKTIPFRCRIGDGFPPYQLNLNSQGNYELTLTKSMALPLNTKQQRTIGWMRCE